MAPTQFVSTFDRLASFISITEVADHPFWMADSKDLLDEYIDEDIPYVYSFDAVVVLKGETGLVGYYLYDDIEFSLAQEDQDEIILRPFLRTQFVSSDSSVAEALLVVARADNPSELFFVNRGDNYVGYFYKQELYSHWMVRACAYAQLGQIEVLLAQVLQKNCAEALRNLVPPYLHNAMELYERRGFPKKDGGHDPRLLLSCTSFSDKIYLFLCLPGHGEIPTLLRDVKLPQWLHKMRNALAHPVSIDDDPTLWDDYSFDYFFRVTGAFEMHLRDASEEASIKDSWKGHNPMSPDDKLLTIQFH